MTQVLETHYNEKKNLEIYFQKSELYVFNFHTL